MSISLNISLNSGKYVAFATLWANGEIAGYMDDPKIISIDSSTVKIFTREPSSSSGLSWAVLGT